MTVNGAGIRLRDAPMERDRGEGWRHLRAAGDVVRDADGSWLLISTEAVEYAFRHPELFSNTQAIKMLGAPVPLIPVEVDPPDHAKYRRVLDPMLAPKVINRMEDELRRQARELILAFADRGSCDIVAELARLYPTQVFLTTFGLPLEDRDRLIDWTETILEKPKLNSQAEPDPEVTEKAAALFGYLQRYIDGKRDDPGDDMISQVLALEGAHAWTNEEVLGMCFFLTIAGLDTVTGAIGFMFLHLARRPDLRRRLAEDPSLVQPIVEEVLRLETPAPTPPRVTTQDVEVCGTLIPAGSPVTLCLGTVNRDPHLFPQGDELDPDRGDTGHRTFGGGIHRCLGSHLARREMRIVAEEFHKLIPDYELAPGADPRIVWPSGTFHLEHLPLVFPRRGTS